MNISGRSITPSAEIAPALGILTSSGMNAPMAMQALPIAESFAVASGMRMDTATRHLTSVLNALGMASQNVGTHLANLTNLSDAFVRSSQLVDVSVEEMSEAFNARFAASLRQAGGTLEQGIGLIGAYANANVRGGDAGNRASIVFQSLEHAMIGHLQTWRTFGIDIQDATGHLKPMADIIEMLENRLGGLNPVLQRAALQAAGFESRVTQALYPLIGRSGQIRELTLAMSDVAGSAEAAANIIRQSFGSQITILWNNVKNLAIDIGKSLAPAVMWLANGIRALTLWFRELNPNLQKVIIWGVLILALVPTLGTVAGAFGTLFGIVGAGLAVIASAIGGFAVWGLAIAALVAPILTVMGVTIGWGNAWRDTMRFMENSIGFFVNFKENLQNLSDWFSMENQADFMNLGTIINTVVANMLHNFQMAIRVINSGMTWLVDNMSNLWEDAKTIVDRFLTGMISAFQIMGSVLYRLFDAIFTSIATVAVRRGLEALGAEIVSGLQNIATPQGNFNRAYRGQLVAGGMIPEAGIAAMSQANTTEARESEAIAGLLREVEAANRPGQIVTGVPAQIRAALNGQPAASGFRTQPWQVPNVQWRGIFEPTQQQAAARAAAILGGGINPIGLGAMAVGGDLQNFMRFPSLNTGFSARRMPAQDSIKIATVIAAGMMTGGLGLGVFGSAVLSQILPAFRGRGLHAGEGDLELPQLPNKRGAGEKFEQTSFNRFMLGGPEVARIEQQVRDSHLDNLIQNTNTLIREGNTQRQEIMNRPPPPAVADH